MEQKKVVYIASQYSVGDNNANIKDSILVADQLALLGFIPRWPLASHFWNMLIPHEHEFWMELDCAEIAHCDCILRLPGKSAGADSEVAFANACGVPVFYSIESLVEILGKEG